jgi:hypothetical protein
MQNCQITGEVSFPRRLQEIRKMNGRAIDLLAMPIFRMTHGCRLKNIQTSSPGPEGNSKASQI